MNRSPLSRRTILRGTGVAVALPLLDAMIPARSVFGQSSANRVPRMACCYVPHGVNNNDWFPTAVGSNWQLTPSLQPLAPLKQHVTVLSGLGHQGSDGNHEGADVWLTGADLDGTPGRDYANSVLIDQVAARVHGQQTRIASLELSSMSGAGAGYHSHTLAFNDIGSPIPGETLPSNVFRRLFVSEGGAAKAAQQQRINEDRSILDAVIGHANSLSNRLGSADRAKLDHYLSSVREVEQRINRREAWIDRPKPQVRPDGIPLDTRPFQHDHHRYLEAMFDLMALALQTDTTRVVTFLTAREAGLGKYDAVGVANHHDFSHHGGDAEMLRQLSKVDKLLVSTLARFLKRLQDTSDGDGTLLDNTMVLYGSGMNNGKTGIHSPKNLPLLLSGGSRLGIRQGQHLRFPDDRTPFCNVHLTMLQKMGINANSFGDSTGTLTGLV